MNGKKYLESSFPVGVKYCQHRDMQEKYWDMDFSNMKDSGIDVIRVHAFWGALEPSEGKLDFAQYDRIVKAAGEHGLGVLFTLYLVSAPEWIFEKHPDSRFVSANGTVWNSNQFPDNAQGGWPGLCFDSVPFRKTVENFVGAFVTHYKDNTDVYAIDIWHEPDEEPAQQYAQNDWRELTYCYCEHSIGAFREWLEKKYGTLEGLNRVWTRHYEHWCQVWPPRAYGTYTEWIDWKNFRMECIAGQVGWLNGVVKKYDKDRATSVHCGIYEIRHPVCSSNDHFRMAELTDMFACSMYDTIHPEVSGFTCDLMRSACRNGAYWIGETETGSGPMFIFLGEHPEDYFAFSRPADPQEIHKISWGAVARGAKGIMYWGWRPDISTMEAISLGFVERDGEMTDRTRMLKNFTSTLRDNQELIQARSPQSEVAVLYHIDAVIQEGFASLGNSGNSIVGLKKRFYKDTLSFIGCYKTCMRNGIQTDFISREMLDGGCLSSYKLLVLPYSIHITKENARNIQTFVANGGKVVSDGMCGFFTENGWGSEVCPPHGLSEVFGVKVRSNYDLITSCPIILGGETCKDVGRFVRERLQVKPCARIHGEFEDGNPAVVSNAFGCGRSAYIGTLFFSAAINGNMDQVDRIFKKALDCVGYKNPVSLKNVSKNGLVEVRRQSCDSCEFVFIINHSLIAEKPCISLPVEHFGKVTELCPSKSYYEMIKQDLKINLEIEPSQVAVFRIDT